MAKHVVGAADDFPSGTVRRVEVEGRGIAVFNTDGRFFALRDACPHQGARLSAGSVIGTVTADRPGCYRYDADRKLVRCPWHGWEYELATGRSWFDPEHNRVRPFQVAVESGESLVGEGRQPGPYVAETIRISIEDDYVVIEL
jgi:3-phenylpropionate/trans-cinnamate dioxygenase ferredoxin subunit